MMEIDSRFISIPITVFALLEACRVGTGLSRRGDDSNAWNTNVNDDLPWDFRDGMEGSLRERINYGEGGPTGSRYNVPHAQSGC